MREVKGRETAAVRFTISLLRFRSHADCDRRCDVAAGNRASSCWLPAGPPAVSPVALWTSLFLSGLRFRSLHVLSCSTLARHPPATESTVWAWQSPSTNWWAPVMLIKRESERRGGCVCTVWFSACQQRSFGVNTWWEHLWNRITEGVPGAVNLAVSVERIQNQNATNKFCNFSIWAKKKKRKKKKVNSCLSRAVPQCWNKWSLSPLFFSRKVCAILGIHTLTYGLLCNTPPRVSQCCGAEKISIINEHRGSESVQGFLYWLRVLKQPRKVA